VGQELAERRILAADLGDSTHVELAEREDVRHG
jgi:hypothetical protein